MSHRFLVSLRSEIKRKSRLKILYYIAPLFIRLPLIAFLAQHLAVALLSSAFRPRRDRVLFRNAVRRRGSALLVGCYFDSKKSLESLSNH